MAYNGMFASREDDPRTYGEPEGELATYREYLTNYRLTLELKCLDLSPEQLAARSVPPSDMSLLGLIRHMGRVEQHWFHRTLRGHLTDPRLDADDPTGGFHSIAPTQESVDEAFARLHEQIRLADEWLDTITDADLGEVKPLPRQGESASVRDILVHMIEEYARHCGHADLLRECIDGRTGQ